MNERVSEAFRLKPTFAARIWGRESLAPWYVSTGLEEKAGEAWLSGPKSVVETGRSQARRSRRSGPSFRCW